ncbi:MAG: mechanosensitive ion channel family protein [Rhodothermales bacterium]
MFERLQELLADYQLFGVPLYEIALIAGAWLVLTFVLFFVRKQVGGRLERLAARTTNLVDDVLSVIVNQTKNYFLIAIALLGAMLAGTLPDATETTLRRIVLLVSLVQMVAWGSSLITLWLDNYRKRRFEEDPAAVTTMQAAALFGRLVLGLIAVLLALDNFGVDVTALVAGLGIGGIAVALAVQNILGDLFASLSIILDKPFVVGDFLIVGDYLGSVEKVGLKTTRLRSLSGEQIIVSNSDLLSSRIRNFKRMYERRIAFTIGVTYETPREHIAQIPDMLKEIVLAQENVRFDRAHFKGFGDFSLDFEIVYFVLVPDFAVYMDIQQAMNLEIMRRFEELGIEFAYPTQMLYVQQQAAAAS